MRCKACNHVMGASEIVWIPSRMTHETLCRRCRLSDKETPIVYKEDSVQEDFFEEIPEDEFIP